MSKSNDTPLDGNGKIDLSKALRMRLENNLSYSEIGKQFGTSKQAAWQALKPFIKMLGDPKEVGAYRGNRAGIFDAATLKFLTHALDPAKLKQGGAAGLVRAASELYKMQRLETDQSTENVANHNIQAMSDETRARLDAVLADDSETAAPAPSLDSPVHSHLIGQGEDGIEDES
ncbi:hypothetical protein DSCA_60080 [Desulfosarcina alkanivorans]|uniref:Uncharacterized protein n=1 Tax=Desulfosarcina alkanivorans TaxID=571177 RepID=A0A5K7YTV8_9BACT|nr:hypothetical protein [Desulfosarcina alkanivorans]BBO72078.1 hypothetical protein DSCA_60080 [Desulfosarcina alkanivorans]